MTSFDQRSNHFIYRLGCGAIGSIIALFLLGSCSFSPSEEEARSYMGRIPLSHYCGGFLVPVSGRGLIECVDETVASVPPKFNGRLEYVVPEGEKVKPGDLLFRLSIEKLESSARRFQLQADRQKISQETATVKNRQAQADREEELNISLIKLSNAQEKEVFFEKGNDQNEIEKYTLELKVTNLSIAHLSKELKTRETLANKGYSSQLELLKTKDSYDQSVLRNLKAKEALLRVKEGKTKKERQKLEKTSERFTISSEELKDRNNRQTSIDTLSEEREKLKTESLQAAAKQRFDILKQAEVTSMTTGTAIHLDLRNWGISELQAGASVWRGMNLVKVSDTSRLKAKIKVTAGDIEHVAKGQKVTLTFPAIPQVQCHGTVMEVGKVAVADKWSDQDGVKLFDVSIDIEDESPLLVPNLSVVADIEVSNLKNATKLPSVAIYKDNRTNVIDVLNNGTVETRPVEILGESKGFTFIRGIIEKAAQVLLPVKGGK